MFQDKNGWEYGKAIEIECDSGSENDRLVIALRFNDDYPYQKLMLELTTQGQRDSTMRKDSVELELTDSSGRWKGNGIGNSYQIEKETNIAFPKDSCTVRIRHIMKTPVLPGIEMIGILSKESKR